MKLTHLLAAAGLAAAVAAPPAQAQAARVTDTEIVLGSHLDLSGPTAAGMPMLRNAMQMRIDEANEAGGVHGRRLRLVVEDNALQPQQAVRAVQKFINQDRVFAIINSFGSGPNAAVVKAATDAGVVYYAPWGASAVFRQISGNSPLLVTTVQNYDTTTATGVSWAVKNWGSKKVGYIFQEGPFGDLVRRGLKTALDAHGLTVAAEAGYKPGDIDFSSQVARMKAAGVDLIVAATVVRETVGVMSEVKKLNWNDVKVLTTLPGRSTIVAVLGKGAVEGLYGIGGWKLNYADSAPPEAKKVMDAYKRKFNVDPDENALNAYSYTDWFVKGLQAAGRNLTADGFVKALAGVAQEDFTTYGRMTFTGNHAGPEMVEIDQVKGGRWVPITKPMAGVIK
ncbi:MAG: ABC transporter substrate-binding protein [Burkholderiales bacterium]|nr:ABC transporter substrate-binding protein [Burkholderiales bacterium]